MRIEELDAEAVRDHLAMEFRFQGPVQATLISMVCEQIRAAVYLFAVDSMNNAVPKLKVVRAVLEKITSLMSALGGNDDPEDLIKRELRFLIELKDLVEDEDARVSLAPCRLVPLDPGSFLLIGGGPSQIFPAELRSELQIVGRARMVTSVARSRQLLDSLPRQSVRSWLASTDTNPIEWRDAYLRAAARRMAAAVELEHVEAFEDGFFRSLGSVRATGKPLFVRFRTNFSLKRFYGLASCVSADGKREVEKFADIEYNDAQRLRLVWSMESRSARLEFAKGTGLLEVTVGHPLPMPEAQFLLLGWFVESKSHSGWPHYYYFPQSTLPIIEAAATALGLQMVEVRSIRKNHD